MEYKDLGRRDYVNRRLRVKGRFVSKAKALKLLFGEDGQKYSSDYTFDQLKELINERFNFKETEDAQDEVDKNIKEGEEDK